MADEKNENLVDKNDTESESLRNSDTEEGNVKSKSPVQFDNEEEFEKTVQTVLTRLRALPSEVSELKVEVTKRDCQEIYSKLCSALNVPESSTFISGLEKERMDLSYHYLGPVGIIPVAKALTICTKVKELNFSYNELGAKSLPAITSLIDQNENIVWLNLCSNGIGKKSSESLGELISRCYFVEYLDLSDNDLGDNELLEIGVALTKISNLKELKLSKNDFSGVHAPAFASLLSKCPSLLKLDLSCNHFEEGAASIFNSLKNLNLTYLNFARNGIPGQAMQALTGALRTNKTLQEFDLSHNYITSKGAVMLAAGLKGNSTLETFKLAHNPIMGSSATVLINSIGGSSLKLLDLSGVRVNLAFFKTLRNYNKSGKEVKILFGSEIRYDFLARDHSVPRDDEAPTKENALMLAQKLADEKGVSLREVFKSIHANLINEHHERFLELKSQDSERKDDDKPRESVEVKVEDLAKGLSSSTMAVPKALAMELAQAFGDEEGLVNMWRIIGDILWRPDDLHVKIKRPRKTPPSDDKSKKEKGKGKK